jgi:L,D-peptidoglycan transpeptidase YkuD (ErfK/YbiS/YcfS/YnhG family)
MVGHMPVALLLGLVAVDDPEPPVNQVVVVRASGWSTTRAQMRRFERVDDQWRRVGPKRRAWLGRNGLAPERVRRQNTGTTPAGVFDLPMAFGLPSGSRVTMPYHRITAGSYWPYDPRDPRTYNVLQTRRAPGARWRDDGQWSERLMDYGAQYRRAVVIGYNLPDQVFRDSRTGEWRTPAPARTDKGGGIFLHVTSGRPTAGCVSVSNREMKRTLRWLDPAAEPRIVIGTRASVRGWKARFG